MHVMVSSPDQATELAILDLVDSESGNAPSVISTKLSESDILQLRERAAKVHLSPAIKDYIVRLVLATRDSSIAGGVAELVQHSVSPRGTLALAATARARALLSGRAFVVPEDVEALVPDVLAHRMVPTWRAVADGETNRSIIEKLLRVVQPL